MNNCVFAYLLVVCKIHLITQYKAIPQNQACQNYGHKSEIAALFGHLSGCEDESLTFSPFTFKNKSDIAHSLSSHKVLTMPFAIWQTSPLSSFCKTLTLSTNPISTRYSTSGRRELSFAAELRIFLKMCKTIITTSVK